MKVYVCVNLHPMATVTITGHNVIMEPITGAPLTSVNMGQDTVVTVQKKVRQYFNYAAQDMWGNDASVVPPVVEGLPLYFPALTQWFVRIKLSSWEMLDIPMGVITNEGGWVNTQAGAEIAATAVRAAIP